MTNDLRKRGAAAPKLTGIREVARRAGVAVSSVSRAFSIDGRASTEMRRRVLKAAREVGYQPDGIARSLRRGATSTIGCMVADIANPTFGQIVTGAGQSLQSHGYAMLIASSVEGGANDRMQIEVLRQRRVDGLLISVVDESDRATQECLAQITQPSVILDRDLPNLEHFGRVLFDHQAGMAAAVTALADLGHRQLAFIGGNVNMRPTRERSSTFCKICEKRSIHGTVRCGTYSHAHGEITVHALLAQKTPPTAIIAGGNQILVGIMRAIRARQLRVPRDLSLITCDEIPLMEVLEPKLAVITRDLRLLGRESSEMLVSMMTGGSARTKLLPVEFRFGPSCSSPNSMPTNG